MPETLGRQVVDEVDDPVLEPPGMEAVDDMGYQGAAIVHLTTSAPSSVAWIPCA